MFNAINPRYAVYITDDHTIAVVFFFPLNFLDSARTLSAYHRERTSGIRDTLCRFLLLWRSFALLLRSMKWSATVPNSVALIVY